MNKISILLLLLCMVHFLRAQQVIPCYTDEHLEELLEENPGMREDFEKQKQALFETARQEMDKLPRKSQQGVIYTIPVVFHVVYNSAYDNISKAQIMDALRILNEDFRRQNPDATATRPIFKDRAADIEVEFALAKIAPDGSCTDGITRRQSALSVQSDPRDEVKDLVQWDPDKYLNIWVVNSIKASSGTGLTLGYANFPWMPQASDGIVIRHDALGQIGTSVYDGRSLTHEVGHYLGLLHPFQGGCNQGDGIGDTPPVSSPSFGCNLNRNSCSNDSPNLPDMIENFMDYSDGVCQNIFTRGQKSIMRAALRNEPTRNNLWTQSNLTATGIDNPPCKPLAAFNAIERYTCTGKTVVFVDESENGTPDTYSWTFPSGSPSTSTDREPVVTYNYAGTYDVSLTVSNAEGSSTVTYEDYVEVKPYYTSNLAFWNEDFESGSLDVPSVSVVSTSDSIGYEVTDLAAKSGNYSLRLSNFGVDNEGEKDEFISPHIFTQFGENLFLNFDFAFAAQQSTNQDQLNVFVSEDCGETWTLLKGFSSGALRSVGLPLTTDFVPSGPTEWKSYSHPMVAYKNRGPVLIKFQFINGGGNNFYLDNINISADNIGLDEQMASTPISLYPNPSNGSFTVDFGAEISGETQLKLRDLGGKLVKTAHLDKKASRYTFSDLQLPKGVYMLEISSASENVTRKVVLQ